MFIWEMQKFSSIIQSPAEIFNWKVVPLQILCSGIFMCMSLIIPPTQNSFVGFWEQSQLHETSFKFMLSFFLFLLKQGLVFVSKILFECYWLTANILFTNFLLQWKVSWILQ
jgi:hypothetical protein